MTACAIKACRNYRGRSKAKSSKNVTYHRLPSDPTVRKRWIYIIRKSRGDESWKPTKSTTICADHFHKKDKYYSHDNTRLKIRKGTVPSKALFLSSVESDISDDSDTEKSYLMETASPSSSNTKTSLPEAKDIIVNVYQYLKTEYENFKVYTGYSCDLSPLANILARTAAATGVTEETVTAIIEEGNTPEGSSSDPVPRKLAKLSQDAKSVIQLEVDEEERPSETLEVKIHDPEDHSDPDHKLWFKIEPLSMQKVPASHQSSLLTASTSTEVKQESVEVDDHENSEESDAVEETARTEATEPVKEETSSEGITEDQHGDSEPLKEETISEGITEDQHEDSESAAAVHHLLNFTYS